MPILKCFSVSVMTVNWVTSEPVPQVVGMAISGGSGFLILSAPKYSRMSPPFVARSPIALAASMGLPPPTATRPSQPCLA